MTSSTIWSVERREHAEPPLRITPMCVCDNCRRFDYAPLRPGNECYWCHAGTFTHRSAWEFTWCPACDGEDFFCKVCHGKRIAAVPRCATLAPRRGSVCS